MKLTLDNLKELTYVDILKILLSYIPKKNQQEGNEKKVTVREATKADIEAFKKFI